MKEKDFGLTDKWMVEFFEYFVKPGIVENSTPATLTKKTHIAFQAFLAEFLLDGKITKAQYNRLSR